MNSDLEDWDDADFSSMLLVVDKPVGFLEEDRNEKIVENAQERAPKGSPIGGQWVGKGGADTSWKGEGVKEIIPKDYAPYKWESKVKRGHPDFFKELDADNNSISRYQSEDGFYKINEHLRNGVGDEASTVARLDDMIDRSPPLPKDTVLFRSVNMRRVGNPDDLIGKTIEDKGFVSASLSRKVAMGIDPEGSKNTVLEVYIPKGTKTLVPNGKWQAFKKDSSFNRELFNEHEAVLPRNSKMKIVDIMETNIEGVKTFRIRAELV